MGYEQPGTGPGLPLFSADSFGTSRHYGELHTALTLLAYRITGELEDAKDLVSECLMEWWEQFRNEDVKESLLTYFADRLCTMYQLLRKEKRLRKLGEHHYAEKRAFTVPAYQRFRIAERAIVLQLLKVLPPLDQDVIRFLIWNELEIEEVCLLTGKTMESLKIIQDRAAYKLRKCVSLSLAGG